MSTKKINAGDTLTVGDLKDDHRGAVIEVGPEDGIISRLKLDRVRAGAGANVLWTPKETCRAFIHGTPVKVITPPPVAQPDEPTILGQAIRIEGDDDPFGFLVWPPASWPFYFRTENGQWLRGSWSNLLDRAGGRQIFVSDPPRWPDETPAVPERIEVGEWPDDDTHLREWEWTGHLGYRWRWYAEETRRSGWAWTPDAVRRLKPIRGPWTRGERVK